MHFYCIFPRKNGKLTHKLIFKWWQKFNHRLLTTIDCLGIQPGLQLKRLNNVVTLPPFMCSLFIEISGFPWHKFQLLCSSILKPLRTYDLPTARVSRQKQWYQCIRSKIFFFGGGGGYHLILVCFRNIIHSVLSGKNGRTFYLGDAKVSRKKRLW